LDVQKLLIHWHSLTLGRITRWSIQCKNRNLIYFNILPGFQFLSGKRNALVEATDPGRGIVQLKPALLMTDDAR
jgi:hypothetical protein